MRNITIRLFIFYLGLVLSFNACKKYEKQSEQIVAQAKEAMKAKDKKKATLLLKKKKMIEKEISKLEGMQMMLEQ